MLLAAQQEGSVLEELQELASEMLDLSDSLFALRCRILSKVHHASVDDQLDANLPSSAPGKRKLADLDQASSEVSKRVQKTLRLESDVVWPVTTSVLSRWSSQTANNASGGANQFNKGATGASQLKAVNQSPVAQIENSMRGDALERLQDRTRTWRGKDRVTLGENSDAAEIFDDSDFYHTLLRELIESRSAAGSTALQGGIDANDALLIPLSKNKIKKQVDTRASKGRKIRYEVHKKIQNFMPPVPTRLIWSDEQMSRLFAQLGGQLDHKHTDEQPKLPVLSDGVRLFD